MDSARMRSALRSLSAGVRAYDWATYRELFTPKLVTSLRSGYTAGMLRADAIAGLTVAILAIPLSMAIAIGAGVSPDKGLITAIVAGFLISALGGSRFQIGGPAAGLHRHRRVRCQHPWRGRIDDRDVSRGPSARRRGLSPARHLHQVHTGAGRSGIYERHRRFDRSWTAQGLPRSRGRHAGGCSRASRSRLGAKGTSNPAALVIGAAALAGIAAFGAGARSAGAADLRRSRLCRRLGTRPARRDDRHAFRWNSLVAAGPCAAGSLARDRARCSPSAFTIAFLIGVELLLSAVAADTMAGTRHRSNMEIVAQGAANIASPLFGGLPATGVIARTGTSILAGAKTPVAGILHSLFILVFVLALSPLASYLALPCLAAVLLATAWRLIEIGHVSRFLSRAPWTIASCWPRPFCSRSSSTSRSPLRSAS